MNMKQFSLINTEAEQRRYKHIKLIPQNESGNDFFDVYLSETYIIIYIYSINKVEKLENQIEIPIVAAEWLENIIVNGFWKKPTDGGLPKNQHAVSEVFQGEEILISRSSNAGTYGKGGFNIRNKARNSYILSTRPQSIQITDDIVELYILNLLRELSL